MSCTIATLKLIVGQLSHCIKINYTSIHRQITNVIAYAKVIDVMEGVVASDSLQINNSHGGILAR
ncbi:hypothetical protein [Clostridium butyricum]|uniref:hypothetical protein n=1 Tax=Clostridium butyricum TaxID=1492 RepID=UPI0013D7A386|nr:hypothetical protein [Clostridium butyricum]MCQ2017921.1 hypothetical protein [Clostridium butyricum]MCQ2021688.1 hypothetical protein [Clostridium butyricum]NFB72364.1 hypothetical protein [Clostridium butyricum]NFB89386.1 hypothetical protein [Clostridium butyricum]UTY52873.1 hypothetical protein HNS01_07115 [Clostridium butyricum]